MKHNTNIFSTIVTAVITASFAGAMTAQTMTASAAPEQTDPAQLNEYIEIIVNQVNNARTAAGLRELPVLPIANHYAQIRAEELPIQFSHTRPDGSQCFSVMKNDGFFYNSCAENIAAGRQTAMMTFDQWMNSEGHRKNIMREDFTHIGIGYVYDPDTTFRYHWSMILLGEYGYDSQPVVYEDQYYPTRELGDADGSHVIDAGDAAMILEYSAKNSAGLSQQVPGAFTGAADVNGDGAVNAIDASIVLSFAAANGADGSAVLADFVW